MIYSPQHIGKCIVFHQVGIFKEAQKLIFLILQKVPKNEQIITGNIGLYRIPVKEFFG